MLSLAPNHAMAHYLLGIVQIFTNRAAQGIAQCERALALDRNLAAAHGLIGGAKYFSGRGEETEAHIQEALRLSPRDTSADYGWFGWPTPKSISAPTMTRSPGSVGQSEQSEFSGGTFLSCRRPCAARTAGRGAGRRAKAGLALDPAFTIRRLRAGGIASSDNPELSGAARTRLWTACARQGCQRDDVLGPRAVMSELGQIAPSSSHSPPHVRLPPKTLT